MLKKYEINLLDFTANIVIIILSVLSLSQYFILSSENRLWRSYFDVGILTSLFVFTSYWLGHYFQNFFRMIVQLDKLEAINLRHLWFISLLTGILNSFISFLMYDRIPGLGYKVVMLILLISCATIGFFAGVIQAAGFIEGENKKLKEDYLQLFRREQ